MFISNELATSVITNIITDPIFERFHYDIYCVINVSKNF